MIEIAMSSTSSHVEKLVAAKGRGEFPGLARLFEAVAGRVALPLANEKGQPQRAVIGQTYQLSAIVMDDAVQAVQEELVRVLTTPHGTSPAITTADNIGFEVDGKYGANPTLSLVIHDKQKINEAITPGNQQTPINTAIAHYENLPPVVWGNYDEKPSVEFAPRVRESQQQAAESGHKVA
jgi:hypothetical protein